MLGMQQYHSKLILLGITLSYLSWVSAGCEQKTASSPSALSTPSQPTVSTSAPAPTALASPTIPGSIPGGSPVPPTDVTGSPALTPEDQAIAQKMEKEVQEKVERLAIQPAGKTFLSNILISQQTEKIINGKFANDLKQLAAEMPTETSEYQLQVVEADTQKSIVTAKAKTPGLPSYTGAVFALEAKIPVTGICKTKLPSEIPPSPPTLVGETVKCGGDSVSAEQ
jgi:Type IV pilin-like G and H, putative